MMRQFYRKGGSDENKDSLLQHVRSYLQDGRGGGGRGAGVEGAEVEKLQVPELVPYIKEKPDRC